MDYVSVLKRAFLVTWRYRSLWLFGFFLALCSGGSGGGSENYSPPGSGDDFYMPMGGMPNIDWQMIAVVIAALLCLVLLAALLGIVVRAVTRTALIFKDVAIIWLLMLGVGLLWVMLVFVGVLPISLLAALLVGGIPALLVYLVSGSFFGAAVTGVPLAILVMVLVISFLTGLYLIFNSSVWTIAYLDMQSLETGPNTESSNNKTSEPPSLQVDPQSE